MKNPFIYGKEVQGTSFCNRKLEIKELLNDINNGQNVLIYSPRRFGKTSLIKEVLRLAKKKGVLTVYVDLYPAFSKQKFIEIYAKSISKSFQGKIDQIYTALKNILPRMIPKVIIKEDGYQDFEFDFDKSASVAPILDDLLMAIKKRADKLKKQAVVVFDEFQEINKYDDNEIEDKMRSFFQSHNNVSYIFMGSKKHIMQEIFFNPNRPFYKSVKHFPLDKIKKEEFLKFLTDKMTLSGIAVAVEHLENVLKITDCHPYYTQLLANILWEEIKDKKKLDSSDVSVALDKLINRESAVYITLFDYLNLNQKKLLQALSLENGYQEVFSEYFLLKYNLRIPSIVQKAIKVLLEREIIYKENGKYLIFDLFFQEWIKRKM